MLDRFNSTACFWAGTQRFAELANFIYYERLPAGSRPEFLSSSFGNAGNLGTTDLLNWRDKVPENQGPITIFANSDFIETRILPGFSQTEFFPDGKTNYEKIMGLARRMDEIATQIRSQVNTLIQVAKSANSIGFVGYNPAHAGAIENFKKLNDTFLELNNFCLYLRRGADKGPDYYYNEARKKYASNDPYWLWGAHTPYEMFYADKLAWNSSPEYQQLEEYRKQIRATYRARTGFISSAEFFQRFFQIVGAIAEFNKILFQVGAVAGVAVGAAPLLSAVAPAASAATGVSASTITAAGQVAATTAAAGGNVGNALLPVGGEALKSIGGNVGFLDDIQKTVSNVGNLSFGTITDAVRNVSLPTAGGIQTGITDAISKITPAQLVNAIAPTPPAPAPTSTVPKTSPSTSSIPASVQQAAAPAGAILALLALLFFAKGK
jgi:hypothetical protein